MKVGKQLYTVYE